jgi:indole-3-glycerol phosphate synthase
MSTILDRIIEQTAEDLKKRMKKVTISDFTGFPLYEPNRKDFAGALRSHSVRIIAEIKKGSPSKGIIRESFNPVDIALRYEESGAACISVLTDEPFFYGSLNYLAQVRESVQIPLLRKDFIIDPYQIAEARAHGADAVLLIAAVLSDDHLNELLHASEEYGLHSLVECYDEEEVNRMNWHKVQLFGVNNRDLRTFKTDVHRGIELLQKSPESVVRISESGLRSAKDLKLLYDSGVQAALIGETFMREDDPGKALKHMLDQLHHYISVGASNDD